MQSRPWWLPARDRCIFPLNDTKKICYAGLTLLLCCLCSLPVHWRNGGGGCFILLVGYLQIKEGNFAFGALCAFRLVLEMRVALQKSAMQRKFLYMPVSAVKLSNTAAF